jgi:hypothetical protein
MDSKRPDYHLAIKLSSQMSVERTSTLVFQATLLFIGIAVTFWAAFFGFQLASPPRVLSDESFRCSFFRALFFTTAAITLAEFVSSALLWRRSSSTRRFAFVAVAVLLLLLCNFHFCAWGFCGG